ncbi:MAG: Tim44/TimA family putative adaptor protein [Rhodobiaceae bacterium]
MERRTIDPLNLILLVIVVFIGFKLRSVLGMRNDEDARHDRSNAYRLNRDAFSGAPKDDNANQAKEDKPATDNVTPLEQARPETAQVSSEEGMVAGETPPDGRGLAYFRDYLPDFNEGVFLDGARAAYGIVLEAFAAGNLEKAEVFLDEAVYQGFAEAIAAREQDGLELHTEILRLDRPMIEDAIFENGIMRLEVRYRAEIISYVKAKGADETPPDPSISRDLWTFERPFDAPENSWKLVATSAE